jgi:Protein of unknown function (DUF817)
LRRFTSVEARIDAAAHLLLDSLPARGLSGALVEFLVFGLKQAWACLFGGAMLAVIISTRLWWPDDAPLARYDFLVLAAVTIQIAMLAFRLETAAEAKVILIFHVVGTLMEIFKTSAGSWIYPEESFLRIAGVPLFSGFMYAAVGSYFARILRTFDVRYRNYPPQAATVVLCIAIYANFFTHHFMPDLRAILFAATVALVLEHGGSLPCLPLPPPHAAAARVPAGGAVHLVRREHRHMVAGVDLSRPGRRLDPGVDLQARRLVPADDHIVRVGDARPPPTAFGRADDACGRPRKRTSESHARLRGSVEKPRGSSGCACGGERRFHRTIGTAGLPPP